MEKIRYAGKSWHDNEVVATDKFSRSIPSMRLTDSKPKCVSYKPYPFTDPDIVSSCTFKKDYSITVNGFLTQFDKSVMDAMITLWIRSGECGDHTYNMKQIVSVLCHGKPFYRIEDAFLQEVSNSLLKLRATSISFEVEDEIIAREAKEDIQKLTGKNQDHKKLERTTYLLPFDYDALFERQRYIGDAYDDNGAFIIAEVTLIDAPGLYEYAMMTHGLEYVDKDAFSFPAGLPMTVKRLATRNYLRDKIIAVNREITTRTIMYDDLYIAVGGKNRKMKRSERQRLHNDVMKILNSFCQNGILDSNLPFIPIMNERGATIGVEIYLSNHPTINMKEKHTKGGAPASTSETVTEDIGGNIEPEEIYIDLDSEDLPF